MIFLTSSSSKRAAASRANSAELKSTLRAERNSCLRISRTRGLMAKLNDKWIVQPHGELIELSDGILTVEGTIVMPLGNFPRRMTVLALRDGGSAIWSPIPLREPEMTRIESLG